ncbi:MAG: hypothetical protein IKC76_03915 [Firmicutes bacterium]|nr:hypothetical protein [Bacillota bacterium]
MMMKKMLILLLLVFVLALAAGCGGDTSVTAHHIDANTLYTDAEISDAMHAVEKYFRKHFDGCRLVELSYDAEKGSADVAQAWAENYNATRALVLISEFTVGAKGGDGSLNPNSTYKNWNWILTEEGGRWEVQTCGY